jgi:predicted Zn-dependent protease
MVRALAAVAAILVCAWFALGAHQAHDTDAATAIVDGSAKLTAAQANRANSLLDGASTLDPDRQIDVLRARVATARGQKEHAEQILRPVVRSEPDNIVAWFAVVQGAPSVAVFKDGLHHIYLLNPRIK